MVTSTTHQLIARKILAPLLPLLGLLSMLSLPVTDAQDLSWVQSAMERSKQAVRESLPAWQYDPRIAAGSADASLHALAVTSADRVWAVGDRGLILATQDGGRSWTQQNSTTTLNLYGVTFVDSQIGYAVGGTCQPLSGTSVGIVLTTTNAGATWQSTSQTQLPLLRGVEVVEGGVVRVWGDYSTTMHSGCLESADQGRTWRAVASPLGHLESCARQPRGLQLAIDRAGRLSQLPSSQATSIRQLALPTAPIRRLHHSGSMWLAVGDEGTLAASADGSQWTNTPLPLSPVARRHCTFQCIDHIDNQVWVGGSPGSLLLHSADGGTTWRTQATEQNWPIHAVRFFDRHRGWAVTEAGSILATRDGGTTWYPQRTGVQRLGLQSFASTTARISWPALIESAWQARQATSLSVLYRENVEDSVDFAPDATATLGNIAAQVGLVSADLLPGYPLPDARVRHPLLATTMIATPNANARAARADTSATSTSYDSAGLADHLVLRLRIARPSVVLADLAEPIALAIQRAAQRDSDLQWMEEELKLAPWKVSKLLTSAPSNRSDFTIAVDQPLRDSGLSIADVLQPVMGFADSRNRRVLANTDGTAVTGLASIGISSGISNASLRCLQVGTGGNVARTVLIHTTDRHAETTRPVDLSKIGNMQLVLGRVHRDKAWQTLVVNELDPNEELALWLKKLDAIIENTPKHEVGTNLLGLGEINLVTQRSARWLATLERGSQNLIASDTARMAALDLLMIDASDERLAWEQSASERSGSNQLAASSTGATNTLPISSVWNSTPFENEPVAARARISDSGTTRPVQPPANNNNNNTSPVQTVSATMPVVPASTGGAAVSSAQSNTQSTDPKTAERVAALKRAAGTYNRMLEQDKSIALRPDIQLAHFARRRGLAELAGQPYPDAAALHPLVNVGALPGWQQVAEQEIALASGSPTLPAWTVRARMASERPQLDGLANDACWVGVQSIELTSPFHHDARVRPTLARFSFDAEYLYVHLLCPKHLPVDKSTPSTDKEPRKYDMALDGTDHVQLVVDTDRDYVSACELGINQAGHTFDRCCRASQWNPRWYVAVAESADQWSAECAVKLSDLTTSPTVEGRAWAISLFRYVPHWDVQSWSQLRSYNPRLQGNGLLLFDR